MPTEKAKLLLRECLPPIILRLIRSFRLPITGKTHPCTGVEEDPAFYDKSFLDHAHWRLHYTESQYFPMWTIIAGRIYRSPVRSILDIGCGPGQVAQLLRDKGIKKYLGIDFSTERIKQARIVCPEFDFLAVDVFETDLLSNHDYDGVVCLEFLEHVERDLQVIEKLRPGVLFWGSVPNLQAKQHVRYFHNRKEVMQRYEDYFDDFRVDEHLSNSKGTKYFLIQGVTKSLMTR